MKTMILVSIVSVLSTVALADIPNMGGGGAKKDSTVTAISGAAAEAIYQSIPGEGKLEASLRTMSETYKVLRSEDGLDQVVCHKTNTLMGRKKVSYDCSAESSNTDKALPVYHPSIKMG